MINELIKDIKLKLNIQGGDFVDAEIESYVVQLRPSQYSEFFKALSGEEFMFKKGIDRVFIVSKKFFDEPESDTEYEARVIATLMHDIQKVVTTESQAKGLDYVKLMRVVDIRTTFRLTPQQAYVMNEIGGREIIMRINNFEPNILENKITEALKKYKREKTNKAIEGKQSLITHQKKD